MKRKLTAFPQPRRPAFRLGYLAGEHARLVTTAERRVADALQAHFCPLLSSPLGEEGVRADARMIVRWFRASSRASLSLRLLLQHRLGHEPPREVLRAVWRVVAAQDHALDRPGWRRGRDDTVMRLRLRPKLSGLHVLRWRATAPPWPTADGGF